MSPSEHSFYTNAARYTSAVQESSMMLGTAGLTQVLQRQARDQMINPMVLDADRAHISEFLHKSESPIQQISSARELWVKDHVRKIEALSDNSKVRDAKNQASDGRFFVSQEASDYYVGEQQRIDPNKMLDTLAQDSPVVFEKFMKSAGVLEQVYSKLSPKTQESFVNITEQNSGALGPCIKNAMEFFSSSPQQLREMSQDPSTPKWIQASLNKSVVGDAPKVKASGISL